VITIQAVNADALLAKFNALQQRVAALPGTAVPAELTAWQTEDMNRKFPNTEPDGSGAATDIWPRSRLELEGKRPRPASARYTARGGIPARRTGLGNVPAHRPILRDVLWDKLVERMMDLLRKTMTWA